MPRAGIAIEATGLVTPLGLDAPTSCAALRAAVTNPTPTRFSDSAGERITGHQVLLAKPWRGRAKLVQMAAMATDECLQHLPSTQHADLPILLCIAERDRSGRLDGLEDKLLDELEGELGLRFDRALSAIVPMGRAAALLALSQARELVVNQHVPHVLLVAADSMLIAPTLAGFERQDRLLKVDNSNGFMPGEAAGAVLLGLPVGDGPQFVCAGVGTGAEPAALMSEEPLRADGLTHAIRAALTEAGTAYKDIDCRITDLSGEQYYFREAALALSRTLRERKVTIDLWHPAQGVGEAGAAIGAVMLAVADHAWRKGYNPGTKVLLHAGTDAGRRVAVVGARRGGR
jgi:3-oxoacyl-[acyl-carrier-protein] synthase-1